MIEWHELIIKEGSEIRKQIGEMMFGRELTDFEYTSFREYFETFEPSIEMNRALKLLDQIINEVQNWKHKSNGLKHLYKRHIEPYLKETK